MIERLINISDHNDLGIRGGLVKQLVLKWLETENQPGGTLQTPIQGVVYVGLVMILSEPYYECVGVNLKGSHIEAVRLCVDIALCRMPHELAGVACQKASAFNSIDWASQSLSPEGSREWLQLSRPQVYCGGGGRRHGGAVQGSAPSGGLELLCR